MGLEHMGSTKPLDRQRSCHEVQRNDGLIHLMKSHLWKSNKNMVMCAGMFGGFFFFFKSPLWSSCSGTILLLAQVIFLKNSITKG